MTMQDTLFARLWRHVEACNNIASPAHLIAFRIGEQQVGWVAADLARALAFFPRDIHFDRDGVAIARKLRGEAARTAALERIVAALAGRGHFRLRGEAFDVRATPDGPVLARMDRGALPAFGVISQGVHVNGFVRRPGGADGGLHLWCGWRSRAKPVAPGQMDNVVAGGIPAGLDSEQTLVKEAEEEASLAVELATRAVPAGRVSYVMANEEGLRRDVLHCFDLELPDGVVPRPGDDEVERFELRPVRDVLAEVAAGERVKFNVNLVLIDFFLRHGLLDGLSHSEKAQLRAGLDQVG